MNFGQNNAHACCVFIYNLFINDKKILTDAKRSFQIPYMVLTLRNEFTGDVKIVTAYHKNDAKIANFSIISREFPRNLTPLPMIEIPNCEISAQYSPQDPYIHLIIWIASQNNSSISQKLAASMPQSPTSI